MTAPVPASPLKSRTAAPPVTMFGPDFPFAYDEWLRRWESAPNFMGAFKGNLPDHYRYQRRLFCHFMQEKFAPEHRGLFLAGDDISWTAGWAEGAV